LLSGVHAILGHRGSGKSRLARAIVAPARRLIVIDTLGEHTALGTPTTPEGLSRALAPGPDAYRYVIRPANYDTVEWIERVAAARPGCCLFVDEIDYWYTDARALPGEGLLSLTRYGRHYEQSLVAVARRPADLSRSVTSQATLWCFPMREPRDRSYVAQFADLDPGELQLVREDKGYVIETELARAGLRGVERGRFNLATGQYSFASGESFSSERA
jgi:hypothetical protein